MTLSELESSLKKMSLAEFASAKKDIEVLLNKLAASKTSELRELNKIFGLSEEAPVSKVKGKVKTRAKAKTKVVGEKVTLSIAGKQFVVKAGRGKLPNNVMDILPSEDKGMNKAAIIAKYKA